MLRLDASQPDAGRQTTNTRLQIIPSFSRNPDFFRATAAQCSPASSLLSMKATGTKRKLVGFGSGASDIKMAKLIAIQFES
jgi:hypothetical protein